MEFIISIICITFYIIMMFICSIVLYRYGSFEDMLYSYDDEIMLGIILFILSLFWPAWLCIIIPGICFFKITTYLSNKFF